MDKNVITIQPGKTYLVDCQGSVGTLIQKMEVKEITKTCYAVVWQNRTKTEYILKTKLGIACQTTPEYRDGEQRFFIIEEIEQAALNMTSIDAIIQERNDQLIKHKRSVIRDMQENPNGELIVGAIGLLTRDYASKPSDWNKQAWIHILNKPEKERIITAASLLVAQLDVIYAQEPLKRN